MTEFFSDSEPQQDLRNNLLHLAADLVPNNRYELGLVGVQLDTPLHKSLEAVAGVELSQENGVDIALGYDDSIQDLYVDGIKIKLSKIDGFLSMIELGNNDGERQYVGLTELGDSTPLSGSSPIIPV